MRFNKNTIECLLFSISNSGIDFEFYLLFCFYDSFPFSFIKFLLLPLRHLLAKANSHLLQSQWLTGNLIVNIWIIYHAAIAWLSGTLVYNFFLVGSYIIKLIFRVESIVVNENHKKMYRKTRN